MAPCGLNYNCGFNLMIKTWFSWLWINWKKCIWNDRYFYKKTELPVHSKNCVAYFSTCSAPVRTSDCIAVFEEVNCVRRKITRCKSQSVFRIVNHSVLQHGLLRAIVPALLIRRNLYDDVFTISRCRRALCHMRIPELPATQVSQCNTLVPTLL